MRFSIYCIFIFLITIIITGCKGGQSNKINRADKHPEFGWEESDTTLRFLNGSELVWQYNFKNRKGKPYFHPLMANGVKLTSESPADHTWHLGLWFSWKYIDGLNYWEYKNGFSSEESGFKSEGVTEINKIQFTKNKDYSTEINLRISYHPEEGPDVMKEERTISISAPLEDRSYYIDYTFKFSAINKDVLLDRTPLIGEPGGQSWGGYAGMSIRYNQELTGPVTILPDSIESGLNNSFMYMGFSSEEGKKAGLTILRSPDYSTDATGWYITTNPDIPFYYYSPSALYDSSYLLKQNEDLILKYRVWVLAGDVNEDDLRKKYRDYLK